MKDNIATFALEVNGVDYAKTMVPRLASLTLEERLEDGSDTLTFTLSNHDGQLAPIKRGEWAKLSLGWKQGHAVSPGLVSKGQFLIDEVSKQGPPDVLMVRARSADLTKGFRQRRDRGWKNTTLGAVLADIARRNQLTARVHPDLAGIAVASLEQAAKSDMAFVRDLGRKHDAIATVKDRKLLFVPIGAPETPGGKALPTLQITRRQVSNWKFTTADREENDGAQAQWHDRGEARRKTVHHGPNGQSPANPRRIPRNFNSEAEAKEAARAEASRASRGKQTFSCDLALGDPAFDVNLRVKVQGWDSEIDAVNWLITTARHQLDATGGYVTSLEMESLG